MNTTAPSAPEPPRARSTPASPDAAPTSTAAGAVPGASTPQASKAHPLLRAAIVPTLLRMSAPGVVLVVFQSIVSIADTYFVGRLGTEPLAGLALVFPMVMLLQMMSAGAMGGGVSAAIARALGAGNEARARRLVVHAVVIALALGVLHTALMLVLAGPIYRALGGEGDVVGHATAYSNALFAGAILTWLANTLASVLRGGGHMLLAAGSLIAATFVHVPLSAGLVNGWWGLPALGIAGAGVAYLGAAGVAALGAAVLVFRTSSPLRPTRADLRLEASLFSEILRVGGLASLSAVQIVLTAVALTGFVGRYGTAALAGYGVGARLELLQVPLVFAVGQALVPMVGTAVGARDPLRAKRVAWTGAMLAAVPCTLIGLLVVVVPNAWAGMFSTDADVLGAAGTYLRIVGPFYPVLGVGIALYFASLGAGRVLRPVLAQTARLGVVLAGGAAVVASGAPLWAMFAVVALAMLVYGGGTALAVARSRW